MAANLCGNDLTKIIQIMQYWQIKIYIAQVCIYCTVTFCVQFWNNLVCTTLQMGEAGFGQEVMGLRSKLPAVPSGAAPGAHYPTGTRGDIQAVTV